MKSITPSITGFLLYTTFSELGKWSPSGTVSITGKGEESEGLGIVKRLVIGSLKIRRINEASKTF